MKNFERFASPATCEDVCSQNLLTSNVISSCEAWSIIKFLFAISFAY